MVVAVVVAMVVSQAVVDVVMGQEKCKMNVTHY